MAIDRESTYFYVCDLCGEDREEEELSRLYNKDPDATTQRDRRGTVTVDICQAPECRARPVSDVFEVLGRDPVAQSTAEFARIRRRRDAAQAESDATMLKITEGLAVG